MNTFKKITLILFTFTFLFSCGHRKNAKHLVELLETETGTEYSISKLHTATAGYVVLKNDSTGEYIAYNVNKIDRETMNTLAAYEGVLDANDVVGNLDRVSTYVQSGYYVDVYDYYYEEVHDYYCDCYITVERSVWVLSLIHI